MKKSIVAFLALVIWGILQLFSCNSFSTHSFADKDAEEGYDLAQVHCKSCHKFPEPDLLNKTTWAQYVLPMMGRLLGFQHFETGGYVEARSGVVMKLEQWNKIVHYYISESPEDPLKRNVRVQTIQTGLKYFSAQIPPSSIKRPVTTCVNIDPFQKQILFGDGSTQQLYAVSGNIIRDSFPVGIGMS